VSQRVYPWLERVTAAVLLLVLVALGWMTLATLGPGWDGWAAQEVQVSLVLALLTAALLLVSLTALLHTRS
jgi:peptidoglycan biosynthesis protein MviN/MurJ (putative lipid II flippase)